MESLFALGTLLFLGLLISALILILSTLLGPKDNLSSTLSTYECGVSHDSNERLPIKIHFYLIAALFLLFDVEGIFFFPLALIYRNSLALNGTLFWVLVFYLFLFSVGLFYLFRKGCFEKQ